MAGLFWTQEQDIGPSARAGHAMAFDAARHRVVLFGGDSLGSAFLADTWAWDGQFWTQEQDIGPSARTGHQLAFDSSRSRVVLFGGRTEATVLNGDTWEWDGQYWTQVADTGPDPCAGAAMAFDGFAVLLFGGIASLTASNPPPRLFGLSWEWDGQHWTSRQDIGPAPRWGHALAFDSDRVRPVLFGGLAAPPGDESAAGHLLGDTWETSVTAPAKLTQLILDPDMPVIGFVSTNSITVTVGLDQAASAATAVTVAFQTGPTLQVTIPAGKTTAQGSVQFPWPGVRLGDYTVRASLGTSTQIATLHVVF